MNMPSFVLKIKEGDEHNIVVLSAHYIGKDGIASGVTNSNETIISNIKKLLDRRREVIEDSFPEHQHGMLSSNELHSVKIQEKFVTSDTYSTATKVCRELCARIDAIAEEKNSPLKIVNNKILQTRMESCQHYQ